MLSKIGGVKKFILFLWEKIDSQFFNTTLFPPPPILLTFSVMRLFCLLIIATCCCFGQGLFGQATARVHSIFDIEEAKQILIDLEDPDQEVQLKDSYTNVIIIETIIQWKAGTTEELQEVIEQGRYELDYELKDGVLTFYRKQSPVLPIVIEGEELQEELIYNVSLPEYLNY